MLAGHKAGLPTGDGTTSSWLRVAERACWVLCFALLAGAVLALSDLGRLDWGGRSSADREVDLPLVVLRVQTETDRLREALEAGDEDGAAASRTRLLAEIDRAVAALERPREPAGGPGAAGSVRGHEGAAWGRAYAVAAVAHARDGALTGDPRQLAHAATLFRLANRSTNGRPAGPTR
jgi:hypothetical protein